MKVCPCCGHRFDAPDWACPCCQGSPPVIEGFLSFVRGRSFAGEAFSPEYFPRLFELEKASFWFRHRTRLILGAMKRYFPATEDILEIGCGTGFMLSEIQRRCPGMRISGSDLFAEGLGFARTRVPGASFYIMDACSMPFEEEFDLVLALDMLEHVKDDTRALAEIFKSIKPGGGVIVTVPQHRWLWSIQDEKACHQRRYTRKDLLGRMTRSGFTIAYVTSFVSFLLPLMSLSRMYGQLWTGDPGKYDPVRELMIHPSANFFLQGVCSLEELLIQSGLTFPVGGSMLCVGSKEY